MSYGSNDRVDAFGVVKIVGASIGLLIVVLALFWVGNFGWRSYGRWQAIQDANNQVQLNEIQIKQTAQLVQVEQQKAQIRVADAEGISKAQAIINNTLTPLYLQHEAIQAQEAMAQSNNSAHMTIYIPTGNEGIPLVGTVNTNPAP